jgi:carbon storage regulator CsrA
MVIGQTITKTGGYFMLVVSRKPSEAVVVGSPSGLERMLKVTVLEIHHGCVRLGIEADAEVPVHRLEVWQRIHQGAVSDKTA